MSDTPKRYMVKIRRLKKGKYGKTAYAFSTKLKAVIFASGYQAAFHDLGHANLYVSVWESTAISNKNHKLVFDTDALKEIAAREC